MAHHVAFTDLPEDMGVHEHPGVAAYASSAGTGRQMDRDILLELRADIKEGFDLLPARLVHELHDLFSTYPFRQQISGNGQKQETINGTTKDYYAQNLQATHLDRRPSRRKHTSTLSHHMVAHLQHDDYDEDDDKFEIQAAGTAIDPDTMVPIVTFDKESTRQTVLDRCSMRSHETTVTFDEDTLKPSKSKQSNLTAGSSATAHIPDEHHHRSVAQTIKEQAQTIGEQAKTIGEQAKTSLFRFHQGYCTYEEHHQAVTDSLVEDMCKKFTTHASRGSSAVPNNEVPQDGRPQDYLKTLQRANVRSSMSIGAAPMDKGYQQIKAGLAHLGKKANELVSTPGFNMMDKVIGKMKFDMDHKDKPTNWMARLVLSKYFTTLSCLAIVANSIWMGYDADVRLQVLAEREQQVGVDGYHWQRSVRISFTVLFGIELCMRVVGLHRHLFCGPDVWWNLFDIFLVMTSISEFFEHSANMNFLRLLRLLKLTKALRLIRVVKFIGSLREILFSLIQTLGCLFWCFVALLLVTYMFAILFVQTLSYEAVEEVPSDLEFAMTKFNSIGSAMLSMFSMISGGMDWYEIAESFDTFSMLLLVFYVFFMMFGLVNVIIGVFCNKALEAKERDSEMQLAREEDSMKNNIQKAISIFRRMDLDGDDLVSRDEFQEFLQTSEAKTIPVLHGFQFVDFNKLWRVMVSFSGSASSLLDLAGFVKVFVRFAGEAQQTEVVMMSVEIEHIVKRLDQAINAVHHNGARGPIPESDQMESNGWSPIPESDQMESNAFLQESVSGVGVPGVA